MRYVTTLSSKFSLNLSTEEVWALSVIKLLLLKRKTAVTKVYSDLLSYFINTTLNIIGSFDVKKIEHSPNLLLNFFPWKYFFCFLCKNMDPRESYVWNMSELTLVPQYIRSYLTLRCLKKPIPILNQPWQCCIIILPYFVTKKGGKEIKKFALLSSFLVSWSLTSVYIGENLFRIMDTLG